MANKPVAFIPQMELEFTMLKNLGNTLGDTPGRIPSGNAPGGSTVMY